jgi:hypothetical protein
MAGEIRMKWRDGKADVEELHRTATLSTLKL